MRTILNLIIGVGLLVGCGGWGGYKHKSEKFSSLRVTFPDKWEVWDRSDDTRDFLVATMDGVPDAQITIIADPAAPDLHPTELYPTFETGGSDRQDLPEFSVEEKGTVSVANAEGRFIKVEWLGEKSRMKGYRALFVGHRFVLNVRIALSVDDFTVHELEIMRMMKNIEI